MSKVVRIVIVFVFLGLSFQLYSQKHKYKPLEIPKINRGETVICNSSYCFVYCEEHEQSKWVAYKLDKAMLQGDEPRSDNFRSDPKVTTNTADNSDYKSSGYDRGHLAPAADMSFDKQSLDESFYYSNISPQEAGFNRGIWKKLETTVRNFANNLGTVYVVTGPILKPGLTAIGDNQVSVPNKFYKAILYFSDTLITGVAFILPNKKSGSSSVFDYAVSIDQLENETDIDFFPELPYFIEKKTEKQFDANFWIKYSD
ncbi:MAG TPA: DNA/RNA non-specific endonuclease [Bacteroidales bacterium]|nr:DNA/RNA non-specific endonuclease [Bacteroidales bacterium]